MTAVKKKKKLNVENCQYTLTAHIEVEDFSSRCMNGSDVCERCGHDTRQFHICCTTCKRITNLPGLALQKEGNVLFNDALNTFYLRSDIW